MQSFCLSYLLPECTPASDAHQTTTAVRGRRHRGAGRQRWRPSCDLSRPWSRSLGNQSARPKLPFRGHCECAVRIDACAWESRPTASV